MAKVELNVEEIGAVMNLLSQVQIRGISPDSEEQARLHRGLWEKMENAMKEKPPLASAAKNDR